MAPPSEMNEIDTNIKWINAYRLYDWSKFDPEKHVVKIYTNNKNLNFIIFKLKMIQILM